jgi:DNA ligase (NAD+)
MSNDDSKKMITQITSDLSVLNKLTDKKLLSILNYLSDKYYNESKSLLSDEVFDHIKEYYEKKSGKKLPVGAKLKDGAEKVILPYYMGSLDKIKPSMKEFDRWIEKYTGEYSLSYKLDGMSILITKNNDKVNMYRRGNSVEAEDLTRFIKFINVNVDNLKNGDAVRGEAVFTKKKFKKVQKILEENKKNDKSIKNRKYKQSRNVVSGLFNNKVPNAEICKYVDVVMYWVLSPNMKISDQMKYLEKKKMLTVKHEIKKKVTTKYLSKLLTEGRDDYDYQIDGMVVVDNSQIYVQQNENPKYAFSFKQVMTDQIMESMVVDIEWKLTKDKYLKPTVIIEPIELLDCDIERATANNAKYIYDNNINVGTVVQMIKANDIIPNIYKIVKPSSIGKPKMPDMSYKWSESGVDAIATKLSKKSKNKVIVKILMMFFDTFNIKELGEGTLEKIVDEGYNDIFKILTADKEDLYDIDGLGKTSVTKIYKNIDKGLQNRQLYEVMKASQILGRGLGNRKFKAITDDYPNIISIYENKGKNHTKKLINTVNGFSDKTSDKIMKGFDDFIVYYKKLLKIKPNLIEKKQKKTAPTNKKIEKYRDKTIVFTGFRDKDIEKDLEIVNSKITTSVSKNTDYVVAADVDDDSNKVTKAKKLGVKVLSKEAFYNTLK